MDERRGATALFSLLRQAAARDRMAYTFYDDYGAGTYYATEYMSGNGAYYYVAFASKYDAGIYHDYGYFTQHLDYYTGFYDGDFSKVENYNVKSDQYANDYKTGSSQGGSVYQSFYEYTSTALNYGNTSGHITTSASNDASGLTSATYVTFYNAYSQSYFTSYNDVTGGATQSYDMRVSYAGGHYDAVTSYYSDASGGHPYSGTSYYANQT